MLGFLVEFFLSILICVFLAYFFFLSAPVEDDGEAEMHSAQVSQGQIQRSMRWWEFFIVFCGKESFVALVYRHIRVSILGLDDVFVRSCSPEGQGKDGTEAPHSSSGYRSGFGKRHRLGRQQNTSRNELYGTHTRREGALWVNVVSRWLAIMILGGGTANLTVWSDRVRYLFECGVALLSEALIAKANRPSGLVEATTPSKSGALGHHPHVRILDLELGLSMQTPQKTVTTLPNSTIDAMQRSINNSPNLSSTWATMSAKVVKNFYFGNIGMGSTTLMPDTASSSTNNFLIDENKSRDCALYGGRSNLNPSVSRSLSGVGVSIPRVTGDIVSVELASFPAPVSDNVSEFVSNLSRPDTAAQTRNGVEFDSPHHEKGKGGPSSSPCQHAASRSPSLEAKNRVAGKPILPCSPALRCFSIPISYEDQCFCLQMSCCLPLLSFLPARLCIPADLLCIECVVEVSRVSFLGCLYAAFHGRIVEFSFPSFPQLNASFEVAAPQQYPRRRRPYQGSVDSSSVFTATSTMRNVTAPAPLLSPPSVASDGNYGGADTVRSISGNFSASEPPLYPTGLPYSGVSGRNEKIQEIVHLAVCNAVRSITYPNVLEMRIGDHSPRCAEGAREHRGILHTPSHSLLSWRRKTATLPLVIS